MTLSVRARITAGSFELDVDFEARPGITVFSGPSASGKSTCIRLIAGLERAEGDVLLDGKSITVLPPEARGIGWAPQGTLLWPHKRVIDHIAPFCADPKPILKSFGLESLADRFPDRLSGGERQRVALARALARSPRLLLLDEPFTALDADARTEISKLVVSSIERTQSIALLVSHDPRDVPEGAPIVRFSGSFARGQARSGLGDP